MSVFGVILVLIFPYSDSIRSSPYSIRLRENTDQNNSEYGHFLGSAYHLIRPFWEAVVEKDSKIENIQWKALECRPALLLRRGPVIVFTPANPGEFFITAVLEKATEQLLLSFLLCESKSIFFKSTEKSWRIVRCVYRSSENT